MDTKTTLKPKLPTNWWGLTIRAIVAFLILLLGNYLRSPIPMPGDSYNFIIVFSMTTFITCAVVVLCVWAWMRWIENSSITTLRLTNWRGLVTGLPGGIVLAAIPICIMWVFLPRVEAENFTGIPLWLTIIYILAGAVILQGFPEELIYRGWLFTVTQVRPWFTFGWTSAAFAVIHLISQGGQQSLLDHFIYLLSPLGFGMLAAALVFWRESIWWAVGVHAGVHIANGLLILRYPAETGVAFFALVGIVHAIMALFIMVLWSHASQRKLELG